MPRSSEAGRGKVGGSGGAGRDGREPALSQGHGLRFERRGEVPGGGGSRRKRPEVEAWWGQQAGVTGAGEDTDRCSQRSGGGPRTPDARACRPHKPDTQVRRPLTPEAPVHCPLTPDSLVHFKHIGLNLE